MRDQGCPAPNGEYWVVNQILAKQLHSTDEGILRYTTALMDKLEQTKSEYANEDAILDDTAGQAYVEQFAQETLDRAERAVKANKVTQQTATTFDAAATFFHLVNIWGTPDQETQQKIKYAKWNAARIAKALKDGKDPNESNPKHEEPQQPSLDPNDPEVQGLSGTTPGPAPRTVTVEEIPDVDLRRDAAGVSLPQSPASGGPSAVSDGEVNLPGVPTELAQPASHRPDYFDQASLPSPILPPTHEPSNHQPGPDLTGWTPPQLSPGVPPPSTTWQQPVNPLPHSQWGPPQGTPSAPPLTFAQSPPPTAAVASPPVNPPASAYYTNRTPVLPHPARAPVPQATSYAPVNTDPAVDEAAMVGAQKHAKWAISALNFEDVSTAVRELRKALELLGAS
ncbi:Vta1 like-domain-containing protein [Apodospora peruviana]|uniref:Vta1 like-domain-containing protein n=1 Tax=Apodospora peruviana TaxID=516989 RepID=A0AAE0ISV8_9PEZI|nr:Vta1 like-domain-containing protein [Apodospora peruviana]